MWISLLCISVINLLPETFGSSLIQNGIKLFHRQCCWFPGCSPCPYQPGVKPMASSLMPTSLSTSSPSLRALGLPKVKPSKTPPWRPPPKVAAVPAKRPLPPTTPLMEKNKEFREVLEEVFLTGSAYHSDFSRDEASRAAIPPLVSKILSSHEFETLKRVSLTWAELRDWAISQGLSLHSLQPVDLALFVQSCKAPSRVLPALQFLSKNLHVQMDLHLAKQLRSASKSAIGQGDKQAPVAQPILIQRLEDSITHAIGNHDPEWPALCGAWVMAMGCVRWEHIQRSRLLKVTASTMLFECLRGKQRGRRAGFQWTCPRHAVTSDADFGEAFFRVVAQQPFEFACIVFHVGTGQELPSAVCRTKVQHVLAGVLRQEDIALLSSKSWRQVGVTWSFLSRLDATQVCALGNWLDTSEFKGNKMPWRYFRAKLQQSTALKHTMHLSLRVLLQQHEIMTWQEVSQPLAVEVREAVERGPLLDIDETGVCFERVSLFSQFQEQVLRIQTGSFVGKQKASRQCWPILSECRSCVSPSDVDPDRFFDDLARRRWARPGHGNRPDPPTTELFLRWSLEAFRPSVISPFSRSITSAWSSLWCKRQRSLLKESFRLVASPFSGLVTSIVTSGWWILAGPRLLQLSFLPSSQDSRSMCIAWQVYIELHQQQVCCVPSLREAVLTIALHALAPSELSSWSSCRNRALATWLRGLSSRSTLPPCRVRLPVRFLCSKIDRGAWHAEALSDEDECAQPACRWRQSSKAAKSFFAGGIIRVTSIHEAVVYGRPWCRQCITFLPGRLQADLDTFSIELK